jgi:hypothetical protein
MQFPLIIREDRRHSADTCLVRHPREMDQVPWHQFAQPVAAEFIDVRSPVDGLFRKYRYVAAGQIGVPRHLIVSRTWEVRASQRERTALSRGQEAAYLDQPDPNHPVLQRIREALGLDLLAFDYSYDPEGRLVVWEANPYPNLSYPRGEKLGYTKRFVERSFAAIAAMYLTAGQLELPPRICQLLGPCRHATQATDATDQSRPFAA